MRLRTVSPEEMYKLRQEGAYSDFIDVRTPAEYHEVHAAGARLVPLDKLDPEVIRSTHAGQPREPLYVISRSGHRAHRACENLREADCGDVVLVEGGTQAWEQAGLPVRRGDTIIDLESQVNIAVGLLVLLGVALGALLSPCFVILAVVGGVTLIYDNLTDSFVVGTFLARLPWNHVPEP